VFDLDFCDYDTRTQGMNMGWNRLNTLLYTLFFVLVIYDQSTRTEALAKSEDTYTRSIIISRLDPAFSPSLKEIVLGTFDDLNRQQIVVRTGSVFRQVFGEQGSPDVLQYLLRRISYILPPEVLGEARFRAKGRLTTTETLSLFSDVSAQSIPDWPFFSRLDHYNSGEILRLGSIPLPNNSPVSGLIKIGKGFISLTYTAERICLFVHEARHSDMSRNEIRTKVINYLNADLFPTHVYNAHVKCPINSTPDVRYSEESKWACDAQIWGPNTIAGVYGSEIYHSCTNCSQAERRAALKYACQQFARVIPLLQNVDDRVCYESATEPQRRLVETCERQLKANLNQLDMSPLVNERTWEATVRGFQQVRKERLARPQELPGRINTSATARK
jgi:hypothetical protein